jgi:hypothetical protein
MRYILMSVCDEYHARRGVEGAMGTCTVRHGGSLFRPLRQAHQPRRPRRRRDRQLGGGHLGLHVRHATRPGAAKGGSQQRRRTLRASRRAIWAMPRADPLLLEDTLQQWRQRKRPSRSIARRRRPRSTPPRGPREGTRPTRKCTTTSRYALCAGRLTRPYSRPVGSMTSQSAPIGSLDASPAIACACSVRQRADQASIPGQPIPCRAPVGLPGP